MVPKKSLYQRSGMENDYKPESDLPMSVQHLSKRVQQNIDLTQTPSEKMANKLKNVFEDTAYVNYPSFSQVNLYSSGPSFEEKLFNIASQYILPDEIGLEIGGG